MNLKLGKHTFTPADIRMLSTYSIKGHADLIKFVRETRKFTVHTKKDFRQLERIYDAIQEEARPKNCWLVVHQVYRAGKERIYRAGKERIYKIEEDKEPTVRRINFLLGKGYVPRAHQIINLRGDRFSVHKVARDLYNAVDGQWLRP